jgi:hypothetical protein
MKMTAKKLAEMIKSGRGMGVGNDYLPWEQITRRRSSPYSNLNLIPVPHLTRLAHYLSRGEREFALLLWWLGAEDVREQFPLWPWPHRQPLSDVSDGVDVAAQHPGMIAVAERAGIPLGRYPGLGIYAILTLDLLATVPAALSSSRLIGFSCKPLDLICSAGAGDRLRARLELDRRYCVAAGIPHHVVHPEQLPKTLVVQLHWLAPIEPLPRLKALVTSETYRVYLTMLRDAVYDEPVCEVSQWVGAQLGWTAEHQSRALKIALWYQHLDADLSRPIHMTRPLIHGGRQLKKHLHAHWFGGCP